MMLSQGVHNHVDSKSSAVVQRFRFNSRSQKSGIAQFAVASGLMVNSATHCWKYYGIG